MKKCPKCDNDIEFSYKLRGFPKHDYFVYYCKECGWEQQ